METEATEHPHGRRESAPGPGSSRVVVSFVVIGRNEEKHLQRCLDSIASQTHTGLGEVLYVDSQSRDRSLAIAEAAGVRGVTLHGTPSAARARNLGWRMARGEFVQFVDGDAALEPTWTERALRVMEDPTIGAAFGWFHERDPQGSIYNRVLDLDWPRETGDVDTFGGIVMIRRRCLFQTCGFPEESLTGEDPLLALEIRHLGHRVVQVAEPMATHDLDIHDFASYWRRSVRTGVAYAEQVSAKTRLGIPFRATRTARNLGCATAAAAVLVAAAFVPWLLAIVAVLVALDVARLAARNRARCGSWALGVAYALHLRLSVVAELLGLVQWTVRRTWRTFAPLS